METTASVCPEGSNEMLGSLGMGRGEGRGLWGGSLGRGGGGGRGGEGSLQPVLVPRGHLRAAAVPTPLPPHWVPASLLPPPMCSGWQGTPHSPRCIRELDPVATAFPGALSRFSFRGPIGNPRSHTCTPSCKRGWESICHPPRLRGRGTPTLSRVCSEMRGRPTRVNALGTPLRPSPAQASPYPVSPCF